MHHSFHFIHDGHLGHVAFDNDLGVYKVTMGAIIFRVDALDPSSPLAMAIEAARLKRKQYIDPDLKTTPS